MDALLYMTRLLVAMKLHGLPTRLRRSSLGRCQRSTTSLLMLTSTRVRKPADDSGKLRRFDP